MRPVDETSTSFDVSYGPRDEKLREWKKGLSEEGALDVFKAKCSNMHVDVYRIDTVVKVQKLT